MLVPRLSTQPQVPDLRCPPPAVSPSPKRLHVRENDPADPLAAQLEAVLDWRSRLPADRTGTARRRPVSRLLEAADRTATALLAHPDPAARAELAGRLAEHALEVVQEAALPARRPPHPVDLVLFHAAGAPQARPVLASLGQALPSVLLAVLLVDRSAGPALLEAGARAVFSTRVPAQDVADAVVACLAGEREAVLLL